MIRIPTNSKSILEGIGRLVHIRKFVLIIQRLSIVALHKKSAL